MHIDELTRISTSNDVGGRLASRLLAILNSFKAGEIQQPLAKRKMTKLGLIFKDLNFDNKDSLYTTLRYALKSDTDLNSL